MIQRTDRYTASVFNPTDKELILFGSQIILKKPLEDQWDQKADEYRRLFYKYIGAFRRKQNLYVVLDENSQQYVYEFKDFIKSNSVSTKQNNCLKL